ncbi:MAG: dTDP-4-amino-4,6-dideoxygalactose transaminase [Candidatus Eremiobacteraeota bacterium]|nr:dTDP-4-amino-4,6-dideoxygalactose transaminase [Candidatus Eremiobacteraeota bacterium]
MHIPFNKPYLTGQELQFVQESLASGHLSGNGPFTKKCQAFFQERYGFLKTFLTASCTDALEMCAILCDLEPGDEVIMPSYTFVSTANAFALRGARIRFADSLPGNPNLDPESVRSLVNESTKVIVVVHYAGIACDMDEILSIASDKGLMVVEDAAQGIDSTYKDKALGSLGDLAAFSFHETKNIQCGQGGLAVVNSSSLLDQAEHVWEKGTNRSQFLRGMVDKYTWVSLGSSFLPGEAVAAILWAQVQEIEQIQGLRCRIWDRYFAAFAELTCLEVLDVPEWASRNGHLFSLVLRSEQEADSLLAHLKGDGVHATTHYVPLHRSPYFASRHDGRDLPNVDKYASRLLRLPIYPCLGSSEVEYVIGSVLAFFGK